MCTCMLLFVSIVYNSTRRVITFYTIEPRAIQFFYSVNDVEIAVNINRCPGREIAKRTRYSTGETKPRPFAITTGRERAGGD